MDINEVSKIAKALSEPNRVEILTLISQKEMCACHMLEHFNITQPTLSHHIKQLKECKIINERKNGKWSYYSINEEKLNEFKEFFKGIKSYDESYEKKNCC